MEKQRVATTWHKILLTTVASSFLLGGCSTVKGWFSSDDEYEGQQAPISGEMRRPENNPANLTGAQYNSPNLADGSRRPSNNPGGAIGTPVVDVAGNEAMNAPAPRPVAPAKKSEKGFFSFLFNDDAESAAPAMQRRVPAGNQDTNVALDTGAANYEAAVPVEGVESTQLAEINADYPDLSNVPAAQQGLDAGAKKDAMMADLTAARTETQSQNVALNSQIASDVGEFTAVPATAPLPLGAGAADAAPVAGEENLEAEFAALVAAPVAAPAATPQVAAAQPIVMGSPPRDLNTQIPGNTQNFGAEGQVASADAYAPAPQIAPQTGGEEWVDVRGDLVNQAVPVENVAVAPMGEPAAVSPIPVVPVGGVSLNAPTSGIRTLPDSRYAARRQAIAAERYARRQQLGY